MEEIVVPGGQQRFQEQQDGDNVCLEDVPNHFQQQQDQQEREPVTVQLSLGEIALLACFNILLPAADVATDVLSGVRLTGSNHPFWGFATMALAFGPSALTFLLFSAMCFPFCAKEFAADRPNIGESWSNTISALTGGLKLTLSLLPGVPTIMYVNNCPFCLYIFCNKLYGIYFFYYISD